MKKFLPIFLFLIGALVLVGVYFFVFRSKKGASEVNTDETSLTEVPLEKRPVVSLTPTSDGHYLDLKVDKIEIEAASLDYELLYSVPEGATQGVPGTIPLDGQTQIERKLLLGSESSGKFRYDKGVEGGSLTLRFRDAQGKLVAKFATDFRLLSDTDSLESSDGKFSVSLNKTAKDFFVIMETFGVPQIPPGNITSGPYGVFASSELVGSGSVSLDGTPLRWTGKDWTSQVGGDAFGLGIFVGTSD
jgi:hypothetical protein